MSSSADSRETSERRAPQVRLKLGQAFAVGYLIWSIPCVVRYALGEGLAVSRGVCTPSEVERALDLGVEVLKFFPAESFGGIGTLKAFAAVYPDVPFMPTGGINAKNLTDYLGLDNVLCCGGSWLAEAKALAEQRFDEIERRAREASQLAGSPGRTAH